MTTYATEADLRRALIGCKSGQGEEQRRRPTARQRERILAQQHDACLYCGNKFGSITRRNSVGVTLRLNWDHFIPYAYAVANRADNWVAACHVCNGIKSCHIFGTVEEARQYIKGRAFNKGYRYLFDAIRG